MATANVQGPAGGLRSEGSSEDQRSGGQGQGGSGSQPAAEILNPDEALNPHDTSQHTAGAAALPGVPIEYREDAAAYFKRLAEEDTPADTE